MTKNKRENTLVFQVGYFPGKLLKDPVPAKIVIDQNQEISVLSETGQALRHFNLSDIKKIKDGQGSATIKIAKQAALNILVSTSDREEFLKSYGPKALEMAGLEGFPKTQSEQDGNAFLEYLSENGHQAKTVDGLDIFAGLGITAALCLIPILKLWTLVIIVGLIYLVYKDNT